MSLIKIAALGAASYVGYRFWQKSKEEGKHSHAAFAHGEAAKGDVSPVRDAGPAAMRDTDARTWTPVDQQSDESFPASDPPGNY